MGSAFYRVGRGAGTAVLALLWLVVASLPGAGRAAVTAVDLLERSRLDGTFDAGAYEAVQATLHFAVDPLDPHNALIADIAAAPRRADGKVEFTADLLVWKPVDPGRGNGVALVDIPNRGTQVITSVNRPVAGQPFGDGFLLDAGYTLVWIGWEHDAPDPDLGIDIQVPSAAGEPLAGLGLAAVRDLGSWMAYDDTALVHSQQLLAFGLSQSGRFLRTFLYYGFNEDEQGRQVFDGLLPHVAGAALLDINRRGARPLDRAMYAATLYPFTDAAYPDPASSAQEGLLDNPRARATQPKIFYTDSANEYWGGGRVAALTHLTPDGATDIDLPANVRRYYLAGTQHVPAAFPPPAVATAQLAANPLDYVWHLRALLTALTAWVVEGQEPPPSLYPRLAAGELVSAERHAFPGLPGSERLRSLGAGVRLGNPLLPNAAAPGAALPLLVPQGDADGNDLAGLRHPELVVPLATYTGWNFQRAGAGNPAELVPLIGGYLALPADAAAGRRTGDPRVSVAERYASKQVFLERVEQEALRQVSGRYLLAVDVDAIVERASRHWDLVTAPR